jgi:hypothetical protein
LQKFDAFLKELKNLGLLEDLLNKPSIQKYLKIQQQQNQPEQQKNYKLNIQTTKIHKKITDKVKKTNKTYQF